MERLEVIFQMRASGERTIRRPREVASRGICVNFQSASQVEKKQNGQRESI